METLHNIVLPSLSIPGDERLYVRLHGAAHCELARPRVRFRHGGTLSTDTFYGGFTIGAWKHISPVSTLLLELEGQGRFVVSLGLHRLGHDTVWLGEQEVQLAARVPAHLPLRDWPALRDGMLFMRLRALGPGQLDAARFQTQDVPPNPVRLGLVITHFRREAQVLPAIERLCHQVLQAPQARGRISLTVVDNSRTLRLPKREGLTHIVNRNLGGSGGFARGLLELEHEARATHALFMDDDASCEGESILRTFALLRFARSDRLAVAGALVNETAPWQLMEKGACFDGKCRPLHEGRDLRDVQELLWAERARTSPDYGGWWLFAFPLAAVERYPFPFFVRGDDVFFSLHNRFDIATLNGVACLGEEFRVKHGPLTAYLDGRYHLVHALLREHGRMRMLRRLLHNQFLKPLFAYQYSSARAFTLALCHVARGLAGFLDDPELAQTRADIARWQPAETLQPLAPLTLKQRHPRPGREKERALHALVRLLTLQGFLLPQALLSRRLFVHPKGFYGQAHAVFGHRRVLYEHWPSNTGYVAEYDRRLFFRELGSAIRALWVFLRRSPQLRREFASGMQTLTARAFWRERYGLQPADDDAQRQNASWTGVP
jgi:galactofuranosylgalactofuranosylrhamnosyl-N-acetylglucosaminyl-diphospho-decaprenol beta-1,5/1,6-galactofuranosyltransferase